MRINKHLAGGTTLTAYVSGRDESYYPYYIQVKLTHSDAREVVSWFRENSIKYIWEGTLSSYPKDKNVVAVFSYRFKEEIDFMAFKLAWS